MNKVLSRRDHYILAAAQMMSEHAPSIQYAESLDAGSVYPIELSEDASDVARLVVEFADLLLAAADKERAE